MVVSSLSATDAAIPPLPPHRAAAEEPRHDGLTREEKAFVGVQYSGKNFNPAMCVYTADTASSSTTSVPLISGSIWCHTNASDKKGAHLLADPQLEM